MRNKIFQKNRAKDCQEIEELPRICSEETDRARQLKIDELSLQHFYFESALDSDSGLAEQGEFLV